MLFLKLTQIYVESAV